jgi:succinate dehydrogenase / fumarate reductase flavoprotein subunit
MKKALNRAPTGDSARGPGVDETPGPHPLTRRRPESSTSAQATPQAGWSRFLRFSTSVDNEVETTVLSILAPFGNSAGEDPYAIQHDLQDCMQELVGIVRTEAELRRAEKQIAGLKQRLRRVHVDGSRAFNAAWHLALDLEAMLTVAETTTLGALERRESRGGHTRADYPSSDDALGSVNLVARKKGGEMTIRKEPVSKLPENLRRIVQEEP